MEVNQPDQQQDKDILQWEKEHRRGRLFGGLFVVIIGATFLLRELGVLIPEWIFSWQMLLITIGLFIGFKHSFRSFGWMILILIGASFLLKEFAPWLEFGKYSWPVAIILAGLFIIFKPKRKYCEGKMDWKKYSKRHQFVSQSFQEEDYIDFNAVFGSINKKIITKSFRGGEINVVFGGAEINLSQADFTGSVELEINSVFGGARLILPPNWVIKSEVAAVMGSVEDKRPIGSETNSDHEKVLILRGNAVFGGIEIQSFA